MSRKRNRKNRPLKPPKPVRDAIRKAKEAKEAEGNDEILSSVESDQYDENPRSPKRWHALEDEFASLRADTAEGELDTLTKESDDAGREVTWSASPDRDALAQGTFD